MRKFYLLSIFFSTLFLFEIQETRAQSVSGVEVAIVGDNLQVTYTMAGLRTGQKFDVLLYSSLDNYAAPLTSDRIVGDLGDGISLKSGNLITIGDPLETLGAITADLNFKVRVTMVYNPVEVLEPVTFFKQKRGKDFNAIWSGGLGGEQVKFDLYRNNELIMDDLYQSVNNRSAEFKMPKVALGTGYSMMMQFESQEADVPLPDFEVKRKKSIAARVFTIAILAVAADFAWYASSGEGVTYDEAGGFIFKNFDPLGIIVDDIIQPTNLPDPPDTPTALGKNGISIFSFSFN